MKTMLRTLHVLLPLALATGSLFAQASIQGKKYTPPTGPAPKTASGKPDFSGMWERPYVPDITKNSRPNADGKMDQTGSGDLPFTEKGKKRWESYKAEEGDYAGACLPFGQIRSMNSPDPVQIMQSDKYFSLLYEQNTWFKLVPIDGRKHRDIVPTWFGDSVGHWEGDTLVVETNNFNGKTRLDTIGHPHSTKISIVEKYSRPDMGHINYEITITDPLYYTKPIVNKRVFTLRNDWEIMEYSCEENNLSLWEGRIKVPKYEDVE
jgi:hypothetical protein